ncbi:GvpL/GvpF family gas vesicle protein [Streptomyces sp. IB2014 016-6]|uniref:GvpL/GvpF family gas vesicle protein n=1 Tax=Streptomyces sp. IB2014 016-6 TaxID=2517818 RepID=UPI0011CCB54B|nr:GvpL/GvpF family gas vesicle protein [Streptomyces sp. IB2014 016-6]TXL90040.1 GvpL/GvpF family gas vesicle protein [Streptomyces sp. IB2014 016-6]
MNWTPHPLPTVTAPVGRESWATYVFAVCRSDHPGSLSRAEGHPGGGPPRLLTVGSLCAVVQDVPAAEFSETALRERLGDAAELERCARAHHGVVTAAAAGGPTVPMPLATICLGDERVRAAVGENRDRFRLALERIAGRAEWAVKVHLTQAGTTARSAAPDTGTGTGETAAAGPRVSGRDYLNRLRGRQHLREQHRESALTAAEQVDAAVRRLAVATVPRRPHGPEVTGKDRTQIMNTAYLIAEDRSGELTATIGRLRASPEFSGIEIDVSGPWAPYSFTDGGELAGHP